MISPGKNRIYISIVIIIGIAVLVPLIFIASSDRESFVNFILQHLQRPYLSNILEQKIITVRKFIWLKYISYALILCDVALNVSPILLSRKSIKVFTFYLSIFLFGFSIAKISFYNKQ